MERAGDVGRYRKINVPVDSPGQISDRQTGIMQVRPYFQKDFRVTLDAMDHSLIDSYFEAADLLIKGMQQMAKSGREDANTPDFDEGRRRLLRLLVGQRNELKKFGARPLTRKEVLIPQQHLPQKPRIPSYVPEA